MKSVKQKLRDLELKPKGIHSYNFSSTYVRQIFDIQWIIEMELMDEIRETRTLS